MQLLQFNDEENREEPNLHFSKSKKHVNTDGLIEPWINAKTPFNKTLPLPEKHRVRMTDRQCGERKKTMEERIEQMYRKYSKEGISVSRQNGRANSRQIYREMLKEFQKAQQFKQMGSKREKSALETEAELYSLDLMNKKISSGVSTYDYKELCTNDSPPKSSRNKIDLKCADKFQRMMKIRDKIRKKNSITVSKQKDKYYSEYQPSCPFSHRELEAQATTQADREKAKMKIRIRNQSKSNITIDNPHVQNEFKVVGVYSNAFEYAINQSIRKSSNGLRGTKYRNRTLNQTFHSTRE